MTTKSTWKTSVATTTPTRSRSCLGTTTRTPTPLKWSVPLSTSLRTADYSFSLESAWGEHTGLCRFRHGHVNTLTCTLFSAFRGEKGAFVCPGVFWSGRIQQGKRLFLPVKMVRQERDAARKNRDASWFVPGSVKIDTFWNNHRKCLLNNYLFCVLALYTVFVYNSNRRGRNAPWKASETLVQKSKFERSLLPWV